MNAEQIQIFRKQRLQQAIDQFWDGKKIAFAKEIKNRDGEPLKDGSYVGQLLKPMGEKNSRPIDEDRVREIEGLRPGLKEWFDASSTKPIIDPTQVLTRARVLTLGELASRTDLEQMITVVATADLLPHTLAGFDVRINTEQTEPADGVLIMVRLAGGSCELGVCRMTVSGFEVDIGRGVVLDSSRHGLIVLGTATETRRVFARMR
jgi:hypothetical protein